jgi:hypothetical protein
LGKVGLVLDVPGTEVVPLGSLGAVVEGFDPPVDVSDGEAEPVDAPESEEPVVVGAEPVVEVLGLPVSEVPGPVVVVGPPSVMPVPCVEGDVPFGEPVPMIRLVLGVEDVPVVVAVAIVDAVGPVDVSGPVVVVVSPPSVVVGPVVAVPKSPAVVVVEGAKVVDNDVGITGAVTTFNVSQPSIAPKPPLTIFASPQT